MKKITIAFGIVFLQLTVAAQLFNDSTVINSNDRTFSQYFVGDNYIFISDNINDSIYVIDINSMQIISSLYNHSDIQGRLAFFNNLIFIENDEYSINIYDASNINNITYAGTLSGLNRGWLRFDKYSIQFIYWMEHWDYKIKILDYSSGTLTVRGNPNTSGKPQGISRMGNYLFVSNAYQISKKYDISNPDNPILLSNFGEQGSDIKCSNKYVVINNYFGSPRTVSLWDTTGTGTLLDTLQNTSYTNVTTLNNICFTNDKRMFDISNGTFDFLTSTPTNITDFNDNYWTSIFSDRIILYSRNPCSDTLINDTTTYYVSNSEFESISPKTYLEYTDSLTNGNCDSIINHYISYIYNPTYCTDTTLVTVYDSISVTDTLIINAVLTGINPPNNTNTIKIYPNPAKTHIYINNGDYSLMNGYSVRINNSLGQTVFENSIDRQEFYINLSDWTGNGTYFVYIIDDNSDIIEVKKIIIQ